MKVVVDRNPNITAFQEITLESSKIIKKILSSSYKNIVDSFELVLDQSLLKGPRRLGVLIATNYDLKSRSQNFSIIYDVLFESLFKVEHKLSLIILSYPSPNGPSDKSFFISSSLHSSCSVSASNI